MVLVLVWRSGPIIYPKRIRLGTHLANVQDAFGDSLGPMYRMRLGTHLASVQDAFGDSLGQCTGCVWGLTWPMYRMRLGTHLASVQDAFGDSLGQCTGCVWGLTWPVYRMRLGTHLANVQDAFGDSLGQCTVDMLALQPHVLSLLDFKVGVNNYYFAPNQMPCCPSPKHS